MPTSNMDFKPAFQAEKITGKFFRMVMDIKEDVRQVGNGSIEKRVITRTMVPVKQEFTEAYMIYFPQGHSMLVAADDVEQLGRIGVLGQPQVVDMNTGEVVPDNLNLSPKEIVERSQHNRPRARSMGGLTEVMEGNLDG